MTAPDVVDRALELLLAHDMAGFAGLWAADGTMEFPFAPDGYPRRLDDTTWTPLATAGVVQDPPRRRRGAGGAGR
ncbi:hypothetical protein [Pseudonocardia sp. DLS-67]